MAKNFLTCADVPDRRGETKAAYRAAAAIFALDFLLHFAYEWSGWTIVGELCPVNESVWEHLKLAFFPMAGWWLGYGWRHDLPVRHAFVAAAVSAGSACLIVLAIHYTLEGALGSAGVAADIASLDAGLFAGQRLALRATERTPGRFAGRLSAAMLAAVSLMMILFTFYPPQIPLFFDAAGGFYGIQRESRSDYYE